jgi:chemotaxis signal transduction protein
LKNPEDSMLTKARALRRDFDESFAGPPAVQEMGSAEDFLAVRIGGDVYALRLAQVRALVAGRRITRVPGHAVGLLGVAGVRGTVVPVYSLEILLGYPGSPSLSWMVMAGTCEVLGLAFERIEAQFRARPDELTSDAEDSSGRSWQRTVVRSAQGVLRVVELPGLIVEIVTRNRNGAPERSAQNAE